MVHSDTQITIYLKDMSTRSATTTMNTTLKLNNSFFFVMARDVAIKTPAIHHPQLGLPFVPEPLEPRFVDDDSIPTAIWSFYSDSIPLAEQRV